MCCVTRLALVLSLACAGSAAAEGERPPPGWDPEIRQRTHELARVYFAALHARKRNPDLAGLRAVVRDLDAELARSSSIPAPLTFGPTRSLATDQAAGATRGPAAADRERHARSGRAIRTLLSRVRSERQALEHSSAEEPRRAATLAPSIRVAKKLEASLKEALGRRGAERTRALRVLRRRLEAAPSADGDGDRRVKSPRFQTHTQHRKP